MITDSRPSAAPPTSSKLAASIDSMRQSLAKLARPIAIGVAGADVRPAGEALRDEPSRTGRVSRCQQVIGAFGAQAVGDLEQPVEVAQARHRADLGHLVDHHLGLGAAHCFADGHRIKPVHDHRLRAKRTQPVGLARVAGRGTPGGRNRAGVAAEPADDGRADAAALMAGVDLDAGQV